MSTPAKYQHPHVEDYHSDDGTPQANVTAKRSKSSNLHEAAKNTPADIISDAATDSGYSSRTAATVSTADSGGRFKPASRSSRAPSVTATPAAVETAAAESPRKKSSIKDRTEKTRPEKSKTAEKRLDKTKEKAKTVVKQVQPPATRPRGESRARKPEVEREDHYREDDRRPRRQAQQVPPIQTDYHRYHQQPPPEPMRSPQRQSYYPPQSPAYPSANPEYIRNDAVVQLGYTRQRRSSSVSDRPRPISYHSADAVYGQYDRLPAVDNRVHGPPPSHSAYKNTMPYTSASPYGRTPQNNYFPPSMTHPTPPSPFEAPSHLRDATYSTRGRPTSMYGAMPPIVSQPIVPIMSPSYTQTPAPSARYPAPRPITAAEDSLESDSEEEYQQDLRETQRQLERMQMPPPTRRPSLRQRHDSHAAESYGRSPSRQSLEPHDPYSRRPSLSSSNRRSEYTGSTNSSNIYVEGSRHPRRRSQLGPNANRHSIPIEYSDEETFPFEQYDHRYERRPTTARRMQTETNLNRREREAREYQQDPQGEPVHASDALLREKIANNSSRRIERARSDSKSHVSQRSTMTKGTNGINLHVSGKEDFNISISGDMQGQSLQVTPAADGGAIVTISGSDKTYHQSQRSDKSGRSKVTSSAGKSSARSSQRGVDSRTGHPRIRPEGGFF